MRIHKTHGRGRVGLAIVLVVAFCIAWGCGEKPEPPPVAYMGPTLASDSLGMEKAPAPKTGYTLLDAQPSTGLFPGALAIARLVQPEGVVRSDNSKGWQVGTIGYEEAITWNNIGTRIPAVREVIVLDQYSTVSASADLGQIAMSADRLEAPLCLVYGPAQAEADHAGLWGTILETATGRKLASVQAQAGPEDFEPLRPDQLKNDMRNRDPNYLCMTGFQQQVRLCLLALIERDRPSTTTQPNPWQSKPPRETPIYIMPPRPTPAW